MHGIAQQLILEAPVAQPGLHLRGAVVPSHESTLSEAIQQNQQGQGGQRAHESRHVQGKMEFQSLRVEVSEQVQKS